MLADQGEQQAHADRGGEEASDDQPPLRVPPGEPVGSGRGGQDPDGARRENQASLDGVVFPDLLQVDRDHEE